MEKILKLFKNFIDFKNILFFWAIILYSDSYYLIFFHRSIENINYEYLKNSLNTINIEDIVSFVILFGIFFIFFIPLISSIFKYLYDEITEKILSIWSRFFKNNNDNEYSRENENILLVNDLYEYSLLNNNSITYDIYKNHESYADKIEEFEKISSFVIFFSVVDYFCGKYYNNGNYILNILHFGNTGILSDISQLLIIGYLLLMYNLIFYKKNEYDFLLKIQFISPEIPFHIKENIKKFKSESNLRNVNGKVDIPKDIIFQRPPKE